MASYIPMQNNFFYKYPHIGSKDRQSETRIYLKKILLHYVCVFVCVSVCMCDCMCVSLYVRICP